jgi:hypothetical protein
MSGSRIEFNPRAIAEIQAAANAAGQQVVRQVNAEMSGRPVGEIATELRTRLRAAGMKPDETGVMECAESISAGTLTE